MRWAPLGSEERMTAQTALRVGIVTEVELRSRADELANEIAARRPLGVQGTVRAMWEARDPTPTMAARHGKFYTDLGNAGTGRTDSRANKKTPRTR